MGRDCTLAGVVKRSKIDKRERETERERERERENEREKALPGERWRE